MLDQDIEYQMFDATKDASPACIQKLFRQAVCVGDSFAVPVEQATPEKIAKALECGYKTEKTYFGDEIPNPEFLPQ